MPYIPGYSPPRSWRRPTWTDLVLALAAIAFSVWFALRATVVLNRSWNWTAVLPYLVVQDGLGGWKPGILMNRLFFTLRLGAWSTLLAMLSGTLIGVLSAHQRGWGALPGKIYINLLRNTPPLVLLFLVYFFAGSFFTEPVLRVEQAISQGPDWLRTLFVTLVSPEGQLDRVLAAILTLGLYGGAYVAEIVRSGLESVPKEQYEAAVSQGFTAWQRFRHIIFPQAMRLMVPPLVGQTISLFKETTLASIISIPELTFQSLEVMAVTRMTFELWLTTAAIYLLISQAWSLTGRIIERRRHWQPVA